MNTLIICDSAKIGGVERLALDQAYEINQLSNKTKATILVLNSKPDKMNASFISNEKTMIEKLNIKILYVPGSRLYQFYTLKNIMKDKTYSHVLTCSMRGCVLAWLVRLRSRTNFIIFNTIQQLPSLTSSNQHLKRVFYSQFSDKLFICCESALRDWESKRQKSLLLKVISARRRVKLCRNGIFLPRLQPGLIESQFSGVKRFLFIGRLTAWKGLETFLKIAHLNDFKDVKILLITPTDPSIYLENIESGLRNRIQSVVGKSISEIEFHDGDVHLYPANYGNDIFIEGISLNVLEMACLGIPSLITQNGCATWPELGNLGLVYEVDWKYPETVSEIVSRIIIQPESIRQARLLIDIKNNLDQMFRE